MITAVLSGTILSLTVEQETQLEVWEATHPGLSDLDQVVLVLQNFLRWGPWTCEG